MRTPAVVAEGRVAEVAANPSPDRPAQADGAPLRVCMLATKFYAASDMGGGLERSARRLIQYLIHRGHRVVVLTRNYDGLSAREQIDGATVVRLPVWGRSAAPVSLSYLVQALWWLWAHRAEYDLIHGHQCYAPATIGVLAKRLVRKPVVIKISTADEFSERRELERLPLRGLRRMLLRGVDRFVTVNPLAGEEFVELGIDPSRIVHIPNGVPIPDLAAFDAGVRDGARARLGQTGSRLVVFVGRLSAEKNLHVLLEAWPMVRRRCGDASLLLVGDGGTFRNVEPQLRRQVSALGLQSSVRFVGRVRDVEDYLKAAEVFVLPSSTEGMSNALLEAMAAALPIIATRVPGNAALIQDGASGLLVEPGDADALGAAILRLLTSPELAMRLGLAARRTVEARCSIERIGQAYLNVYRTLLTAQRPS